MLMEDIFFFFFRGNKVSICEDCDNALLRRDVLEENRTIDSREVHKSNDIEIQINAAFNDAYRIPRP